ncbi:MAG: amino acid racemase [Synergistaceae bacterium]|nr:amino acid racemase [Synergistaceae bacterium]
MTSLSRPKKTLGVLGGMGPAASAEFLAILARDTPAERDQDHPRVLMISDPSIPDRTEALLGTGEDPTPFLRKELERLVDMGANLLAVPCNTAHCFIDRFREALTVPLVHIVEATLDSARRRSPKGAWLLSTSGTRKSNIYPEYASRVGYEFFHPADGQQERIQESLTLVKAGKMSEAGRVLREVIEELRRERDTLIVTACTELPLAYAASGLPREKEVSSLQALSDACLRRLF